MLVTSFLFGSLEKNLLENIWLQIEKYLCTLDKYIECYRLYLYKHQILKNNKEAVPESVLTFNKCLFFSSRVGKHLLNFPVTCVTNDRGTT
ncbi:MAG: hypothetical protein AYK19_08890 [Theionarchaea archaeon DG-70-1]|nr:MAG: hypothetical protein AYK19_08890 [Theionarchaea archaeon DG-70-1]